MAGYRPSSELCVVRPCGESWEAMDGGSRVRHCGSCDRDVLNVVAMTPRQLETVIAESVQTGVVPCMRMVKLNDGSLLTANEIVRPKWYQRVAAGVGAMMLSAAAAEAQDAKPSAQAALSGDITDPSGARIPGAGVLLRRADGVTFRTTADRAGHFVVEAAPGSYELDVDARGFTHYAQPGMVLQAGDQALDRAVPMQLAAIVDDVPGFDQLPMPVEAPLTTRLLTTVMAPPLDGKMPLLQGRVTDASGAPIPGAIVELSTDSKTPVAAQTDDDGRFELVASPGMYLIAASAKYFAKSNEAKVELVKGARELAAPIRLEVVPTMGEVVISNKPLKTQKVRKTKAGSTEQSALGPSPTPAQR